MASASPLEIRADEVITCPICLEDFISPRQLPGCMHSFCFRCLQGHCRDKLPGDRAHCPLCRDTFRIPENGIDGFKLNFVLQSLIDAKHASGVTTGAGRYDGLSMCFGFSSSVFTGDSNTAYLYSTSNILLWVRHTPCQFCI